MQGANKTINTKVGLDLPMSEQVRQRQVTLNEGKTLVNTKGVYGSKFGNETHFLSFIIVQSLLLPLSLFVLLSSLLSLMLWLLFSLVLLP